MASWISGAATVIALMAGAKGDWWWCIGLGICAAGTLIMAIAEAAQSEKTGA